MVTYIKILSGNNLESALEGKESDMLKNKKITNLRCLEV